MGRVFGFAQRVVFCAATVLMVTGTCVRDMSAQDTLPIPASSTPRFGGPQDWSNRHVIYTRNGSFEDMLKLRDDPRFMHSIFLHYMREHGNGSGLSANSGLNEAGLDENSLGADTYGADTQALERLDPWKPIRFRPIRPSRNKNSKVDWSVSLGPTAGMAIGESPAVYTYNYATPSCSTLAAAPPVVGDFIVYTINAAPSTVAPGQANLVGLTNLYTAGDGTGYCSGTGPSFLFSYAIGSGALATVARAFARWDQDCLDRKPDCHRTLTCTLRYGSPTMAPVPRTQLPRPVRSPMERALLPALPATMPSNTPTRRIPGAPPHIPPETAIPTFTLTIPAIPASSAPTTDFFTTLRTSSALQPPPASISASP